MVAVPGATAVARPCEPDVLLIVAIEPLLEFQFTDFVMSYVEPLLKVPVAVNCCVAPTATDEFDGVTAMEVNPVVEPDPDKLAVCGLLPPLSLTVSVPVRVPTTVGVNVMLIVHLPFDATPVPQVFV